MTGLRRTVVRGGTAKGAYFLTEDLPAERDDLLPRVMGSPDAAPKDGGTIATRTFIPHRCHTPVGVLGVVTVATARALPDGPAHELAHGGGPCCRLEHPTGHLDVEVELDPSGAVRRSGVVRTARKLFDGVVFPR